MRQFKHFYRNSRRPQAYAMFRKDGVTLLSFYPYRNTLEGYTSSGVIASVTLKVISCSSPDDRGSSTAPPSNLFWCIIKLKTVIPEYFDHKKSNKC